MTSLLYAAMKGHLKVVEYLVNKGTEINEKNGNNMTSLHFAASNGHHNVVEFLVNNEADINEKDIDSFI